MPTQNQLKTQNPHEALALWIAQNQPELFKQLAAQADKSGRLNGITDWLSGVGSSLGSAVKSVGSYIASPAGVATLGTLGTVYLQSQSQKNALKVQTAQAQAGAQPQPIYDAGGNVAYYRDPQTGQQYPVTNQVASQLMPTSSLSTYLPYILAGVGLLAIFMMSKKS